MSSLSLFSSDVLNGPVGEIVLAPLRARALQCRACPLSRGRTQVIFGAGNSTNPPIAFIGEAPGRIEDTRGEPFVGPSGILLDRMITSMGYQRSSVYLCTVVMCCTPGSRRPSIEEIASCRGYLVDQLRAVKPLTIVTLGDTAVQTLLKTTKKVDDLRGKWFDWENTPVRSVYHPAYLLKSQSVEAKKKAWIDLQAVGIKVKEILASSTAICPPHPS